MSHPCNDLIKEEARQRWEEAMADNNLTAMVAVEDELRSYGMGDEARKLEIHRKYHER